MRWSVACALLLVGSAALAKPAANPPRSSAAPGIGEVRVYAFDRGSLIGLYCATKVRRLGTGRLCRFSTRLALPVRGKTIEARRRDEQHDGVAGPYRVSRYRLPSRQRLPVLVVETRHGLSIWTAALADKIGPNAERLPIATPTLERHRSRVTVIRKTTFEPQPAAAKVPNGGKVTLTTQGTTRTWTKPSWTNHVVLGTFDLDGDDAAELITLSTDDYGSYVCVVEVGAGADQDRIVSCSPHGEE